MSLAYGACSKVGIGANPSRLLLPGNLRGLQTLSTPTSKRGNGNDKENAIHIAPVVGGQWKVPSAIPCATSVHFSSLSATPKMTSSLSYQNSAKFIAQTTRSMTGLPQSHRDGKPTLEYAKKMPKTFATKTNEQILLFAELGIPEACRECIVRDVMAVDNVGYDEAMKVFDDIAKTNREGMFTAALPFYVGLGAAVAAGYISIPLVFDLSTVKWFNQIFVTAELPPQEDLETVLEVGSASWGWMEPVLGQISFFLLCMQFSRAQMQNLGIRPYFNWQQECRAKRLIRKYPRYDAEFLVNYSKCDRLAEPHEMGH